MIIYLCPQIENSGFATEMIIKTCSMPFMHCALTKLSVFQYIFRIKKRLIFLLIIPITSYHNKS
jgi:hypothetical protein